MLKQTIKYEDFDENVVEETLYFNLSRIELADNLDMRDDLQNIERKFKGETRQLKPEEIKEILDVIKRLIKISYGVRSEDGKRFIKNDQVWEEFTQSAAYDAFLMDLFERPERANDFMIGLVPKQMRADVEKLAVENTADLSVVPQPAGETVQATHSWNDFNDQQKVEMSQEDFERLVGTKDPNNMTADQLRIAFIRKSSNQ